MAANGVFTYHDLYGGKPEFYQQYQSNILLSPIRKLKPISLPNRTITFVPITPITRISSKLNRTEFNSLTALQSNIYLYKFVPFIYVHWILIGLAAVLSLLLLLSFIYYCFSQCRRSQKLKNKEQPSSNFYRHRTSNPLDHAYNIYETTTPRPFTSSKHSHRSKSKKHSHDQCLDQDLETAASPLIPRVNISETTTSSAHTDTTSSLLTEMKSRLSTRSSETSLRASQTYEVPVKRVAKPSKCRTNNNALLIDTD